MPRADWNLDNGLGNAKIDDEHRRMVEILDALRATAGADSDAAAQGRLLDEMIRTSELHFRSENALMRLIPGGPQRFAAHIAQHQMLLFELAKLREEVAKGGGCVGPRVLEFLERWLFEHMDTFDRELAEFDVQTSGPVAWLEPDN